MGLSEQFPFIYILRFTLLYFLSEILSAGPFTRNKVFLLFSIATVIQQSILCDHILAPLSNMKSEWVSGNVNISSSADHPVRFSSAMTPSRLWRPKASTCTMRKGSATWIASTMSLTVNTQLHAHSCRHFHQKLQKHTGGVLPQIRVQPLSEHCHVCGLLFMAVHDLTKCPAL